MEDNKKNAKIFYLTLAVILAVVVLLIIAMAVARRSSPDTEEPSSSSSEPAQTDDQPTINENELPNFVLPVKGDISYDYSMDRQVFSPTMNDWRTHNGIDISASIGAEVFAVADGVIKEIKNDDFMGTSIIVEHDGNAISIYRNLSPDVKEGLKVGASVKSGDVIGYVGETAGNEIAQEPHLHYELKINGKHVDPKEHLPIPKKDDAPSQEQSSSNPEENKDKQ